MLTAYQKIDTNSRITRLWIAEPKYIAESRRKSIEPVRAAARHPGDIWMRSYKHFMRNFWNRWAMRGAICWHSAVWIWTLSFQARTNAWTNQRDRLFGINSERSWSTRTATLASSWCGVEELNARSGRSRSKLGTAAVIHCAAAGGLRKRASRSCRHISRTNLAWSAENEVWKTNSIQASNYFLSDSKALITHKVTVSVCDLHWSWGWASCYGMAGGAKTDSSALHERMRDRGV